MSRQPLSTLTRLLVACLVGLPVASVLIGCGGGEEEGPANAASSDYQVADDDSDTTPTAGDPTADTAGGNSVPAAAGPGGSVPAPPAMPPMDGDASFDLNAIPDGEAELLAYLEKLQSWQPQARSQLEFMTAVKNMSRAKLAAADKLLASTQDQQTRFSGTQAKLDAMRALAQLGDEQLKKELHGYCRTLIGGQDEKVAELGRLTLFGLAVDDLLKGNVDDIQSIVEELKARAAANPDNPGVFGVVSQAAGMIEQMGETEAALECYLAIYETYKDSKEPQLAKQVRALELLRKLNVLLASEGEDAQPVLDDLASVLSGDPLGVGQLNTASQVAQTLEMAAYYEAASDAFTMIEQAYKDNGNPQLAEAAAARVGNSKKRVALVGQPFVVEGVLVDGTPFDWTQYQGKVVLIDFWATWCGPCLQEIPNIEANYEKFRDRGFEVVGINLDEDPQAVERFLSYQPSKWTIVVSSKPGAAGFSNPMAVKCGIDAIPFLILVDREGKVNAIHIRGEQLEEKLTELLGPAVEEEAPTVPAAPTIPAAPVLPTTPKDAPAAGDATAPAAGSAPAIPILPPENATPPANPAPPETPSPQSSWSPNHGSFFLSPSRSHRPIQT